MQESDELLPLKVASFEIYSQYEVCGGDLRTKQITHICMNT
jgi:hypothetical protein